MNCNFLRMLYPNRCAGCGELLTSDDNLCDDCKDELEFVNIRQFRNKLNRFDGLVSVFYYRGTARNIVLRYKFSGKKYLYKVMSEYMTDVFKDSYSDIKFDFITYVPMTATEYMKRGFNQTELLANKLADNTNIEFKKLFSKIKNTKSQSTLDSKQRENNLKNCFKVIEKSEVKGKTILLVDDVKTTGATLNECSKVLRKAGAKEIYCITFAIAEESEINTDLCTK